MAAASPIRTDDPATTRRPSRSPPVDWQQAAYTPLNRERVARYESRIAAYEPARGARMPRTGISAPRRRPRRARRPEPVSRGLLAIRARRIVAIAALLLVAIAVISYGRAMLAPSNVGFGVRSVEWLRDHGAAWLVSDIERIYYSANAPQKGGPPLKSLPNVARRGGGSVAAYAPAAIKPLIEPPLPGEGQWRAIGPAVNGVAPVLVTTFRPDPNYPKMVAGVAWIDRRRTSVQLYPGRYEPPAGSGRGPMEVPQSLRGQLAATFNSGFRLEDSGGGFVALGHVFAPLHDGLATLVGYRDGSVDVRSWSGGPESGSGVQFARQNLPLIVDNGRLNPRLSNGSEWGATLGNEIRVWRSGIGVDAHGDLLYAAANDQTAESLALILQRAGAVRAMELDINYEWVTFNFYGSAWAADPSKLLPGMDREATRYLSPDDRDFFAVFRRGG